MMKYCDGSVCVLYVVCIKRRLGMARKTCVASRPLSNLLSNPLSNQHVRPRNAYLVAGGFCTAWPWDAARGGPSDDSPAARGRPVARVEPRVFEPRGGAHANAPRLLLVEQPDEAADHALMLARRLYRPHRTQMFDMAVLRRPDAELGPGVWPRIEITSRNLSLEEAGYQWANMTEEEKEEASAVLWRCFNDMFPPATAEDAAAWAAERWYEPVVREFPRGEGLLRNGVEFACESTGGSMVTFRFEPGSRRVDVQYSGPVHLSLERAVSRPDRALSLELRRYIERRAEERAMREREEREEREREEREREEREDDELEREDDELEREDDELERELERLQRQYEDRDEYNPLARARRAWARRGR
jgi:hypothetical protein